MKLGNVLALAVAVSGLSLVGCEEKPAAPAPKTTTPPAPTTPPPPPAPGTPAPTPG